MQRAPFFRDKKKRHWHDELPPHSPGRQWVTEKSRGKGKVSKFEKRKVLRKALTGSFNSQNAKQFVVTTIFIAANMEKRGPMLKMGPKKRRFGKPPR